MKSFTSLKCIVVCMLLIVLVVACSDASQQESKDEVSSKQPDQKLILGERIDGPANVRDSINGRVIYSLYDGAQVEAGTLKDDWYEIGLWVDVTPEQEESFKLLPGDPIMSEGIKIGKVTDTAELWISDDGTGYLPGFTFRHNIKKETIPEHHLAQMINRGLTSKQDLEPFMKALDFEKDKNAWKNKELEAYMVYEAFLVDPSPMDRITLLFKNNELAAISHSRSIELPRHETIAMDRGFHLTIIAGFTEEEVDQLVKERNLFLNSVD